MPMTVARGSGEAQDHDVRPEAADVPHHVGQHFVARPLRQRFVGCLRKTEVDRAGKELLRAVDASRCEKFLGADDAHLITLLGSDEVLSAFTACERQISRADVPPSRQVGEQSRILVVRMGGDHHRAAERVQTLQGLANFDFAGQIPLRVSGGQCGDQK